MLAPNLLCFVIVLSGYFFSPVVLRRIPSLSPRAVISKPLICLPGVSAIPYFAPLGSRNHEMQRFMLRCQRRGLLRQKVGLDGKTGEGQMEDYMDFALRVS